MKAACVGQPIAVFFPEHHPGRATDYEPALSVCRGCEALTLCRRKAEEAGDIVDGVALWGVVGGCAPVVRTHRPKRKPGGQFRAQEERAEPNHGTAAGYKQHLRLGQEACYSCRRANAESKRRKAS